MSQRDPGWRRPVGCASGCGWVVAARAVGGRMGRARRCNRAAWSNAGDPETALRSTDGMIFRGYPDTTLPPRSPSRRSSDDFLEAIRRERRRLGLNSALRTRWLALALARSDREKSRSSRSGPGAATGPGWTNGAGELAGVRQSRPNPRGGSTLSSSSRSSAQIASSLAASALSWSVSGRLSSHP